MITPKNLARISRFFRHFTFYKEKGPLLEDSLMTASKKALIFHKSSGTLYE